MTKGPPNSLRCLLPREHSGRLRQPTRRWKPKWLRAATTWTCRVTRFLLFAGTPARSTRCERSINGFNLRTSDDEDLLIPAIGMGREPTFLRGPLHRGLKAVTSSATGR